LLYVRSGPSERLIDIGPLLVCNLRCEFNNTSNHISTLLFAKWGKKRENTTGVNIDLAGYRRI